MVVLKYTCMFKKCDCFMKTDELYIRCWYFVM